jgi:hypothetical protein
MIVAETVLAVVSGVVTGLGALMALMRWAYKQGRAAGTRAAQQEAVRASEVRAQARIATLERLLAETHGQLVQPLNPARGGSIEPRRSQQRGEVGHTIHAVPDEARADRLHEPAADLPAINQKTGEPSSEAVWGESRDERPHVRPPRESDSPAGSKKKRRRSLPESVSRLFRWMIPPTALAVLPKDRDVLQEEAMWFIETELNRAYTVLGPPPGLENPAQGGQFDVQ